MEAGAESSVRVLNASPLEECGNEEEAGGGACGSSGRVASRERRYSCIIFICEQGTALYDVHLVFVPKHERDVHGARVRICGSGQRSSRGSPDSSDSISLSAAA